MSQIILLVLGMIPVCFTLFLENYKAKKTMSYQNDERWNYILSKANLLTQKYYDFLIVIIAILLILDLFVKWHFEFTFDQLITIIFMILIYRNLIETLLLLYLDKHY